MSIMCPRCQVNSPTGINLREDGKMYPHLCEECTIEEFGEVSNDECEEYDEYEDDWI